MIFFTRLLLKYFRRLYKVKFLSFCRQETALFTGTLRFNLDPEGRIADNQIWSYVRDAKLKPFLDEMADGLDTMIQPGGSSLSNGEQKVICCIRGLIRKIMFFDPLISQIILHLIDVHRINNNN